MGFGDIVPITSAGRWVVGASILVGSAVVPAQAAALVEALFNRQEQKDKDKKLLGDNAGLERQGDLATLVSRLDRLEQKVDETNAKIAESNKRIDRVLALLESKKGD